MVNVFNKGVIIMSKIDRKVVIMGLGNINNYGDNFILQCVKYVVDELGTYTSEIVDFEPPMCLTKKIVYFLVLCLSKICLIKKIRYRIIYFAVKIRCQKEYKSKLLNAGALIFGCGSFKYGTQKLWAYYSLAIELADLLDIPVMFNAMNIQRYDAKDWRCQFLREHANSECVKVITSRDGEFGAKRLIKDYHMNKNKIYDGVGDVAFWIPECYGIKKKLGRNKVGINLIYGNIFKRYGNVLTEGELVNIYVNLLHKLDGEGVQWEFFTNGLSSDYEFGKKVLKKYGKKGMSIIVPESDIDLLNIIVGYEKILGARLHACIGAYALDIPFVGFLWDEKLLHFSEMTETKDNFIQEKRLTSQEIYSRLNRLNDELSDKQKAVRQMWKERTYKYIREFLEDNLCK